MSKPKWQRARFIRGEFTGAEMWLQIGEPQWLQGNRGYTPKGINKPDGYPEPMFAFLSNVHDGERGTLSMNQAHLEFLPEFAEDVPMIPWSEWRKSLPPGGAGTQSCVRLAMERGIPVMLVGEWKVMPC